MTINFNYPLSLLLVNHCRQHQLTLTVAESCTGGGICESITAVNGSSKVLDRGFVTYSNDAKIACLNVSAELLEQHGAVSSEVAASMAQGALEQSKADIALSITGIAGPTGGSAAKPVGTVWFGLALRSTQAVDTREAHLTSGRKNIRRKATQFGLEWILSTLYEQNLSKNIQ